MISARLAVHLLTIAKSINALKDDKQSMAELDTFQQATMEVAGENVLQILLENEVPMK